jgi:hypothetical protein
MSIKERPDYCDNEHLEFLDRLREIGSTNMFGASPYIQREYGFTKNESRAILGYWMDTFSERHSV